MAVSMQDVKELKEMTGAGILDCQKTLTETNGDKKKAAEILREKGLAAVAKKAGRIAAEGVVASHINGKVGALVEVNCETDFVARTERFQDIAKDMAAQIAKKNISNPETEFAKIIAEATATIGEKISFRRFVRYECKGLVTSYIHLGGKIGVLVEMNGGNEELAKNIAMQIAAANPKYLNETQVPADELAKEMDFQRKQFEDGKKPAAVVDKIMEGQRTKYLAEICLNYQPYVRDPKMTISKLLAESGANVVRFTRFEMGEGLEKRSDDFAAEVAAQSK